MFYFLYGNSPMIEFETEKKTEEILEKYPNISAKYYDCALKEEDEFLSALQVNSIFKTVDFLILKRAETLKSSGIQKLFKTLKNYDLNEKNIIILNYVKDNLNITERDAKDLIELLGSDYYHIKNETNKIAAFLDGQPYSFEKIKNLISIDKEYNMKDLVENFFKTKNFTDILNFLETNKDSYLGIVYMLADELIVFLKLTSLINSGKISQHMNYNVFKELYNDFSDLFIGRNFKAQHPYTIFLKLNSLTYFSEEFLENKLKELLYIEYGLKTGEREINIELDLFLKKFFTN